MLILLDRLRPEHQACPARLGDGLILRIASVTFGKISSCSFYPSHFTAAQRDLTSTH